MSLLEVLDISRLTSGENENLVVLKHSMHYQLIAHLRTLV